MENRQCARLRMCAVLLVIIIGGNHCLYRKNWLSRIRTRKRTHGKPDTSNVIPE